MQLQPGHSIVLLSVSFIKKLSLALVLVTTAS